MTVARRYNVESARDRDKHPWWTRPQEQRRFRGLARRGGVRRPHPATAARGARPSSPLRAGAAQPAPVAEGTSRAALDIGARICQNGTVPLPKG